MSDYEIPDNIIVGPFRNKLDVKVVPFSDGQPTKLIFSGSRAFARFLMTRKLAGSRYDQTSKQSYNLVDAALARPFVSARDEVLGYLYQAGLSVSFDEEAVEKMQATRERILAPYSRWYPIEDDDGTITDWEYSPGGVRQEDRDRIEQVLDYLGWRSEVFKFTFNAACEILTKRDVLAALPMGSGKTRLALMLAEAWKYMDGHTTPTIIFAKKRHLSTFREELGGVKGAKPCRLLVDQYGPACYEEWIEAGDEPRFDRPFLLVSLDRAVRFTDEQMDKLLEVAKTSSILLDESYVAQNPSTQISRFLHQVRGAHHIAMSGTPWKSYVDGLASVLMWVHRGGSIALPDYPLGRDGSYKRWREDFLSYAVIDGGGRKKLPIIKNQEMFWEMMEPLMFRRLRNDPEIEAELGKAVIHEEVVEVDLSPEHDKTYRAVLKQFTDWYIREIEARRKRGEPAIMPEQEILVKLGYLIQNVRAPWRMEDHSDDEFSWPAFPRQMTAIHEAALKVVKKQVAEGNNTIVFGISVDAMELLAEEIGKEGIAVALVHGGVPQKEREAIFARCRTGEIQVLVGTFGTLAEGLNLSFANRAVVIDTPWDPSTTAQALGRITRGIQETEPKAWFIEARGTIQQFMIRLCKLKKKGIDNGLDRRKMILEEDSIPDIQAYVESLVNVGDPDQVPERAFFLENALS